ncbi:MAG: hypothetical protein R3199_09000 [Gemmatimonadota bacterium]|nr:hypothetical protein [Gemmatimonadota bacterium]
MTRTGSWMSALFAIGIAVVTAAGACGGETGDEPGAADTTAVEERGIEVTGVTLGTAVGPNKRVTAETETFAPSDTIYASVETVGVAGSAELAARWSYEDGQVVNESTRTIAPNGPEITEFHVSKPDGWPTGQYEVVILLEGQEADRASFTVEAGS